MSGEVIKSFLVGLGFEVDDGSLAKFNKSLVAATVKVTALYAATAAMAAAVVKSLSDISGEFEQMGYEYRLIAPSINKALLLRQELLRAYSAAGVNIYKTIQASVKLNFSLDKTKFALKALYTGVAARFFPLLQKQSDAFRQKLYQNMPKIQHSLEKFIAFVFKAIEGMTTLGLRLWSILTRVYDFFVKLDKATDGWSTIILGVVAAWKLLNLSFLASPLGLILVGLTAILALFDDFKTWQEGGKSLFDWSSFLPIIKATGDVIDTIVKALDDLMDILLNVGSAFAKLFHLDFKGFFDGMMEAIKSFNASLMDVLNILKNVFALSGSVGHWAAGLFGNGNAAANIQNNPVGQPLGNPVGNSVNSNQTNQHVNQQTSIYVNGAADAHATGQAVAGQQTRVQRDSIDYLKGSSK